MSVVAPELGGRFLVLEGVDGAGTTTQSSLLAEWISGGGTPVHNTFEPSDGRIGRYIRTILTGAEAAPHPDALALLFAADRVDHVDREVSPKLQSGHCVISDRYVGSSLAYQSPLSGLQWVSEINSRARRPDLVLYVRVPVDVALARIGRRDGERREYFEKRETLERVSSGFDNLYCAGHEYGYPVTVLDGTKTPEEVFQDCAQAITEAFTS